MAAIAECIIQCPHCRRRYPWRDSYTAGQRARCRRCGQVFAIHPVDPAKALTERMAAPAQRAPGTPTEQGELRFLVEPEPVLTCPFCHEEVPATFSVCPHCDQSVRTSPGDGFFEAKALAKQARRPGLVHVLTLPFRADVIADTLAISLGWMPWAALTVALAIFLFWVPVFGPILVAIAPFWGLGMLAKQFMGIARQHASAGALLGDTEDLTDLRAAGRLFAVLGIASIPGSLVRLALGRDAGLTATLCTAWLAFWLPAAIAVGATRSLNPIEVLKSLFGGGRQLLSYIVILCWLTILSPLALVSVAPVGAVFVVLLPPLFRELALLGVASVAGVWVLASAVAMTGAWLRMHRDPEEEYEELLKWQRAVPPWMSAWMPGRLGAPSAGSPEPAASA